MAGLQMVLNLKRWVSNVRREQKNRKETIDVVAAFVPNIVLGACLTKVPRDHHVRSVATHAAVVIVDISGFSKLSEFLVLDTSSSANPVNSNIIQKGVSLTSSSKTRAGTEKMQKILDSYFGQLVSTIAAHGGDVLRIAGDAVIAIFNAEDGYRDHVLPGGDPRGGSPQDDALDARLGNAVLQASNCCLELQRSLGVYRVEGHTLHIHVGIGAGRVDVSGWKPCVSPPSSCARQAVCAHGRAPCGTVASPFALRLPSATTSHKRAPNQRAGFQCRGVLRQVGVFLLRPSISAVGNDLGQGAERRDCPIA